MEVTIVPDNPAAAALAEALLRGGADSMIRHRSGHPWIIGSWTSSDIRRAATSDIQLVLLGRVGVTDDELGRVLRTVRAFSDVDALYERAPGAYLTVVSIGGVIRVHAPLAATHEVFHTAVHGIGVAANRVIPLRRLIGARRSERALPLLLLAPRAPWPLSEESLWDGIDRVPHTAALRIDRAGIRTVIPRWSIPTRREPLADIAPRLHAALRASVAARGSTASPLACDLSGGLDSSTLAFFADEGPGDLISVSQEPRDATNDDARWADLARSQMRHERHLCVSSADGALWYSDWNQKSDGDGDSPYPALRTIATTRTLASRLRSHDVRVHLTGLGGDELFSPSFTSLHALARLRPLRAIAPVRRAQAMGRWTASDTLRGLAAQASHATWLHRTTERLTVPASMQPRLHWEPEPRLPPWATISAVEACRAAIADAAWNVDTAPVGDRAVDFEMLRLVVATGRLMRRMSQASESFGVAIDAPYLDDAVLDLAFRVRLQDRVAPGIYKPVLRAAAPESIPTALLDRRSKGDYSAEAFAGLEAHRAHITRELHARSALRDAGLIDTGRLGSFLEGVHPDTRPLRFLDATLGVEMWLRDTSPSKGSA